MTKMLHEIFKYRDLLFMLIKRDIRVRYKQAAMGFLWAIFMPVVAVMAGIVIKKAMAIISGKPIELSGVVSVSVKVLPWTFFISAIKFSVQSLVSNSNLVTKIYFPKAVLPLASIGACVFDFLLAITVLTILLTIVQIGVSIYLLWIPFLIICLFLLTAGLGLLLAAANLFFRDVRYIVEVILMFGIFFTPVFYSAATFKEWGTLLLINPIGSIIECINTAVVLQQMPDVIWLSYAGISSLGMFLVGMKIFHEQEPLFAENI